jgi:uncharacterized protein
MRVSAAPPFLAPVGSRERISSIDVLRGFALLGILLMNIVSFALPDAAYWDPTIAGGATGANLKAWLVSEVLFQGKMRSIFSMLFGAGVVLLTARAEARGEGARIADIYYRRTLWLIAFGLLHAYFIWSGDILYGYGVAGLFLYPFRRRSARFLVLAGAVVLALLVPKTILDGREIETLRSRARLAEAVAATGKKLTVEEAEARRAWADKLKELKPPPSEVAREIEDHRGGYRRLFLRRMREVTSGQSIDFYRYGFFDVAGMMLLGMGLVKLGVFSAARSRRFYLVMALAGYGVGVPINWYVARREILARFDPAAMAYGSSVYDLGRCAVALAHVGVVMLVCRAGLLRGLRARLAAVGQMALSNYLMHSLICTTLFYGYGFGLFARLQRIDLLYVVLPIWIVQLIASPIWLRRFRFGPMEWVWRSLTYLKPQPMRLSPPLAGPAAATVGA